jgi:hypothetical protein
METRTIENGSSHPARGSVRMMVPTLPLQLTVAPICGACALASAAKTNVAIAQAAAKPIRI